MINNVVLVGRMTRDAELRYTPSNQAVATFSLSLIHIQMCIRDRAYSVDRAKTIGSFDVGKQADITIYDAPNLDQMCIRDSWC